MICFRAAYRSMPSYVPPSAFTQPLSSSTRMTSRLCRRPTSKSLGSWAGVIFTQPVPKSISTYSSATMGISRFIRGRMQVLPTKCL